MSPGDLEVLLADHPGALAALHAKGIGPVDVHGVVMLRLDQPS